MTNSTAIGSNTGAAATHNSRAIGDTIAMQLSAIAYCSLNGPNSIKKTLAQYLPDWKLVWEPVKAINGNYAFIAYNGVQYVIAIRGSILEFSWASFDNWIEQDFNILEQVPWPYTNNTSSNPMISKGASDGLNDLIALTNSKGETILTYLTKNAFPQQKFLCVTGHSLGANLATVYAPYLKYQMILAKQPIPAIFSILTFAAPTAWNKAFADQFDLFFTNTWRYYNIIDIVPFSACSIDLLAFLYPPPAPSAQSIYVKFEGENVTLADAFISIQAIILAAEVYYNSYYTTVNQHRGSVELNTTKKLYPVTSTDPVEKWFEQAGEQHDHNHYLDWLGGVEAEVNCVK